MSEIDGRRLKVFFPPWDRQKLERETIGSGWVPVDRYVVNMLRHKFTNYDVSRTAARHRAACEAIAANFEWLSPECARQIERRAQSDEAGNRARRPRRTGRVPKGFRVRASLAFISPAGLALELSAEGHMQQPKKCCSGS